MTVHIFVTWKGRLWRLSVKITLLMLGSFHLRLSVRRTPFIVVLNWPNCNAVSTWVTNRPSAHQVNCTTRIFSGLDDINQSNVRIQNQLYGGGQGVKIPPGLRMKVTGQWHQGHFKVTRAKTNQAVSMWITWVTKLKRPSCFGPSETVRTTNSPIRSRTTCTQPKAFESVQRSSCMQIFFTSSWPS